LPLPHQPAAPGLGSCQRVHPIRSSARPPLTASRALAYGLDRPRFAERESRYGRSIRFKRAAN
uniref:KTSC domain-containing protein n=1 Tax=Macrostomum lignano TaxID=282301 RepID=A0A1I8IRW2_9PLAT